MIRTWHSLVPFVPDNIGSAAAFVGTRGLCIFHDMNGSISCLSTSLRLENTPCMYAASLLDVHDSDYAVGKEEAFFSSYLRILEECKPEFVLLADGPISVLTGIDLEALATRLENETGLRCLAVKSSMDRFYDDGLSASFLELFKQVEEAPRNPSRRIDSPRCEQTALIGLNAYDYAGLPRCREIVEKLAPKIATAWGCEESLEAHAGIFDADKVIIMSASGYKVAEKIARRREIPCETLEDCDDVELLGTLFKDIASQCDVLPETGNNRGLQVLICGDHVIVHALARYLKRCHRNRFETASFAFALPFSAPKTRLKEDDLVVKSEEELLKVIGDNSYDLVIADPALKDFVSHAAFAPLENYAFSPRARRRMPQVQ